MLIRGNGWGNFSSKFCSSGVGKCDSIRPYVCYWGTFAVGRRLLPWTWAYCGCRRVAFHPLTNSSAVVPLKTNHLDDAVRSGLRYSATRSGQSPVRSPKSWPSAQCLSSCAKPGSWTHRKPVLGRVRLATPRTTFREDCIKGGGLGGCLKGAWLGGSLQCLYRTPGDREAVLAEVPCSSGGPSSSCLRRVSPWEEGSCGLMRESLLRGVSAGLSWSDLKFSVHRAI